MMIRTPVLFTFRRVPWVTPTTALERAAVERLAADRWGSSFLTESRDVYVYAPVADDSHRLSAEAREWRHKLITLVYERSRRALPPPKLDADGEDLRESPFDEINFGSE
jgi:hypothetical protein